MVYKQWSIPLAIWSIRCNELVHLICTSHEGITCSNHGRPWQVNKIFCFFRPSPSIGKRQNAFIIWSNCSGTIIIPHHNLYTSAFHSVNPWQLPFGCFWIHFWWVEDNLQACFLLLSLWAQYFCLLNISLESQIETIINKYRKMSLKQRFYQTNYYTRSKTKIVSKLIFEALASKIIKLYRNLPWRFKH